MTSFHAIDKIRSFWQGRFTCPSQKNVVMISLRSHNRKRCYELATETNVTISARKTKDEIHDAQSERNDCRSLRMCRVESSHEYQDPFAEGGINDVGATLGHSTVRSEP